MKVLVTGANGYLGQGVVKVLLDMGQEVIAFCHSRTDLVDKRAQIIQGDLYSVENPYMCLGKPDVLLHMAWRDGFVHYSDAHIDDLPQHVRFIKKMVDSDIKQIAVMGSMHEVGFYEGSINENTSCNPESFYGIAKNALRESTKILCKQNNKVFQWLRGYYIVGNSILGSSIFSKISAAIEEGKSSFPFTKGLNQFDFIDYNDFCIQVAAVVIQNDINGIINICSGRPEKLSDRFIEENDYQIKLEYGAFPDRPYDSKAVWGDDEKIKTIINNSKLKNR